MLYCLIFMETKIMQHYIGFRKLHIPRYWSGYFENIIEDIKKDNTLKIKSVYCLFM